MIRERVAEKFREWDLRECFSFCCEETPCKHCRQSDDQADQILAITNPPVTVEVSCDKCANGYKYHSACLTCKELKTVNLMDCGDGEVICVCGDSRYKCTCANGKVKSGVVWEINGNCAFDDPARVIQPLHALDLLDADVRYALNWLEYGIESTSHFKSAIPNNKGTLRLEGE